MGIHRNGRPNFLLLVVSAICEGRQSIFNLSTYLIREQLCEKNHFPHPQARSHACVPVACYYLGICCCLLKTGLFFVHPLVLPFSGYASQKIH